MASSTAGPARSSLYRQYSRSSSGSVSIENLPPRTLARVAREVRDLIKNPPEGIRLVVDEETGLPANLGEIVVSDRISRCQKVPNSKSQVKSRQDAGNDYKRKEYSPENNEEKKRHRCPSFCFMDEKKSFLCTVFFSFLHFFLF